MKMLCTVKLSPHRYKTPEGYLYCKDAIIARTGKQTYMKSEILEGSDSDEYIEVDRKPEQVFDEKTMASFENAPLTIEHPSVSVSPENYKELSVGHVQNIRRGVFEGQDVLYADILVNDAEAIDLIESGDMVELSCGYDCDITTGPNPEQINIRGNHVALCEQGRAGIARIQDAMKAKIDTKEIDSSINYHYRTDKANELDMGKFASRMIWEYLPNELSRQLTPAEKEYVKSKCKSLKADSWGAKPVEDAAGKGTLIQEFGKQGKQYKIAKIIGNVIYAESLLDGKTVLFKKDEENIEWATITKSEVRDVVSKNQNLLRSKKKHWTIDLNHYKLKYTPAQGGDAVNYAKNPTHEFSENVYDNFDEALADAKKLFEEYKGKKEIDDTTYGYYTVTIVEWQGGNGFYVDEHERKNGVLSTFNSYDKSELQGKFREQMKKDGHISDSAWGDDNFQIELETMSDNDYDLYESTYLDLNFKRVEGGKVYVSGDEREIEEFLKDYVGQWDKIGKIMSEGTYVSDSMGEQKFYRITTFPVNRGRYFVMADHLSLQEAKEYFDQVVNRISKNNANSSFAHMTYVFLDEDTEFFNDNVIKSADVDSDGKVSVSNKHIGDRSIPESEYSNIDVENAASRNGYLWAKDKSESELLTKAYWSADGGKTWATCGMYPKQPNRSEKGNRTQAGKMVFRATNAKGFQKEIGRNILTWYANNGGGEVDDNFEIDHIDGDFTNDKLSNLRRITHSENVKAEHERRKAMGRDKNPWYATSEPMKFPHKNGQEYEVVDRTFDQMKKHMAGYGATLVRKDPKAKGEFEYIPGTQFLSSMNGNMYARFKDEKGAIRTLCIADYDDYINEVDKLVGDSWGISLQGEGKGSWLDESDKPTADPKRAKKFSSQEEAEEYCKSHCKGMVAKIGDSFDSNKEAAEIEKLIKGIKHSKPSESWGSLTIDFPDKKTMRKAADKLWPVYDIELFDTDDDGTYIAVYDKLAEKREGGRAYSEEDSKPIKPKAKDSEPQYAGFDLLRGAQSKEFKQYLRDRGLYFEPSDNGDYVHFEVKNADKFVKQRADDIREHHKKFGDSFSRKFYVKAIKALEDRLAKLDRKVTLDEDQFQYEQQKNNLRDAIKKQIAEYKRKLNAERIGIAG